MMSLTWLRNGRSRRSEASALCILADEIIFMAPVIFSEDATEPIRPLSSLSVAIIVVLLWGLYYCLWSFEQGCQELKREATSAAAEVRAAVTSSVSLPAAIVSDCLVMVV